MCLVKHDYIKKYKLANKTWKGGKSEKSNFKKNKN